MDLYELALITSLVPALMWGWLAVVMLSMF